MVGFLGIKATSNASRYAKKMRRAAKKMPKALNKKLRNVAVRILADASRRAPVRTGALRASGRITPILTGYRVSFGGGGTGVNYAAAVEFGSATQTAKPFLQPAVEENRNYARQQAQAAIKDVTR